MVNDLTREQRRYLFLKRITDILIAAVAVVFLAIPMLLIALTLKILYPRIPVLFKQQRVGRNGELFTLIKFWEKRRRDLWNCRNTLQGSGTFCEIPAWMNCRSYFRCCPGK